MSWGRLFRKDCDEQPANAAGWIARLHSENMAEGDAEGLEAWLAADDRNRQSFEALNAQLLSLEGLRSHPEILALREGALRPAWFRTPLAIAAAICLVLTGVSLSALFTLASFLNETQESAVITAFYETREGNTSAVALPDGSRVFLDASTAIKASMEDDRRQIHVLRGRANFVVAKDKRRPFVVTAADRTIVALGTEFEVNLAERSVEVVLMEGRVAVHPSARTIDSDAAVVMQPGYRLVASDGNWTLAPVDLRNISRWRDGLLIFDEARIGDIVVELNRYLPEKIVIASPALADQRMSAVLKAGDVQTFLSALDAIGIARWERNQGHGYQLIEVRSKNI